MCTASKFYLLTYLLTYRATAVGVGNEAGRCVCEDPMSSGSVRLSDASIGALTASLTLMIVTLSVAVVATRSLLRRRRRRHDCRKSHDYGTPTEQYRRQSLASRGPKTVLGGT